MEKKGERDIEVVDLGKKIEEQKKEPLIDPKRLVLPIAVCIVLMLLQKLFLGNYPTLQFIISIATSIVCVGCLFALCPPRDEE